MKMPRRILLLLKKSISYLFQARNETGDFSEYTYCRTNNGNLQVSSNAGLAGSIYGLSLRFANTDNMYVYKDFIPAVTSGKLRIRFYLDPNSITMADGSASDIMALSNTIGFTYFLNVAFGNNAGSYSIRPRMPNDAGSDVFSNNLNITDEPHCIELLVKRSLSNSSSDGSLEVWIDGISLGVVISGIDNFDKFNQLSRLSFGAWSNDATTTGTIYLDELVVNDTGAVIGPR